MAKDPVTVDAAGMATAVVTFPAVDANDAAMKVRGWVLHSGCAMSLSFAITSGPIETDLDGVPGLVEQPPVPQPTVEE